MTSTSLKPKAKRKKQAESVDVLLASARKALRKGDWQQSYKISLEATRLAPENAEAWAMRFQTAVSSEERLFCLSQISRIDPNYPGVKYHIYHTLWDELEREPYLAYMEETDDLYYVRSKDYISLAVPKDRAAQEKYPPERPKTLSPAYRWLALALVGLVLSGLGTLVFAPLAVVSAGRALSAPLKRPDRIRAWIVLLISLLLLVPALFLGWLLLVHF